jgi:hypothetical protein
MFSICSKFFRMLGLSPVRPTRSSKPSPLRIELKNLERNLASTEEHLSEVSEEFWRDGGVCCPCCGVPGHCMKCPQCGYSDTSGYQEDRK